MIYYENRSLFVHIPRTSGLSISKAVMSQKDPEVTGVNVVVGYGLGRFKRHSPAHQLSQVLTDWQILDKITVVRNPWRIIESSYRHMQQKRLQVERGEAWATSQFRRFLEIVKEMPFADFVPWHFEFLRGGFYAHWCRNWDTGADLGVKAYRYEQLDEHWPAICETLLIPGTLRPHENAANPLPLEWSDQAVEFVRQRCQSDFDLFDYSREP